MKELVYEERCLWDDQEDFTVSRGMRIAQMVVAPVTRIAWRETDRLADTPRGASGFGSTGTG